MKLKEWKFNKHIPPEEMQFMATKLDKRKSDAMGSKDTVFVRGDIQITQDRFANFKKLKRGELMVMGGPLNVGEWYQNNFGWSFADTR